MTSLHAFFKSLINSNNQTISKVSSAELAFASWEKNKKLAEENETYLTNIYVNDYEAARTTRKLMYDTYMSEKAENTINYYKTRKAIYLNKILDEGLPGLLYEKASHIYTKYHFPSSMEAWMK